MNTYHERPSGQFKNYWDYIKRTQDKPLRTYIYRRYWKHNMVRIKLVVMYINLLKLFGHDICRAPAGALQISKPNRVA